MSEKYFKITPLEQNKTYIVHNIVSKKGEKRRWIATQIIGSQTGYRHFENPIHQREVNDRFIPTDPKISGYVLDEDFDYVHHYEYWFDGTFSEKEQEKLIGLYEGESDFGIGAAWLDVGSHNWKLDGEEALHFECDVKIDLIDDSGEVINENIKPIK